MLVGIGYLPSEKFAYQVSSSRKGHLIRICSLGKEVVDAGYFSSPAMEAAYPAGLSLIERRLTVQKADAISPYADGHKRAESGSSPRDHGFGMLKEGYC